jgi:hypothetical protein
LPSPLISAPASGTKFSLVPRKPVLTVIHLGWSVSSS